MKFQSFRFLWLGQAFANLGDVFYIVGLISVMYTVTESVFYLASLPFINTCGRFLSGFISPILFNKYSLKTLLSGSQLSKTVVLLSLLFWIYLQPNYSFIVLLIFIFVLAFLDGWAGPASRAMLPRLVSKEEIVKANGFVSVVNQIVQLGGWALGGVLVAFIGGQEVIWLTFILFIVSSVMMFLIQDSTSISFKDKNNNVSDSLKEGWKTIWNTPMFRRLHVVIFLESMANVVWIAAIIYVFVSEVLQKNEAWWGYINTTFFAGLLIGGVFCTKYSGTIEQHLKRMMLYSSFGVSIITFLFGFNSVAWVALALSVLFGIVEQIKSIAMETYLQKEATPNELPKIYGAQGALTSLTFGLSSLLIGAVADIFGVQYTFFLAGMLLAIAAIYLMLSNQHFQVNASVSSDN